MEGLANPSLLASTSNGQSREFPTQGGSLMPPKQDFQCPRKRAWRSSMAELTAHNDARSETVLQEFRAPRMVDKAMTYDDVFKFSLDPSPASAIRFTISSSTE